MTNTDYAKKSATLASVKPIAVSDRTGFGLYLKENQKTGALTITFQYHWKTQEGDWGWKGDQGFITADAANVEYVILGLQDLLKTAVDHRKKHPLKDKSGDVKSIKIENLKDLSADELRKLLAEKEKAERKPQEDKPAELVFEYSAGKKSRKK